MVTADTHVTSSGTFSPSSKEVRELFPRSSSLSPRKHRKQKTHAQPSPLTRGRQLREVAPNEVAGRMVKSPWERARAGKLSQAGQPTVIRQTTTGSIEIFEDPECAPDEASEHENEPHCVICSPTKARVNELEVEVARLKGDVLMFKAVLRRQGLPMPSSVCQR